jgi:hypothetical protein
MTINTATKMLEDSMKAISDRQAKYGPPNKNFECIAELWEAYLRGKYGEVATIAIDSADVAAMSGLIKVARLAETPDHEDSWVDLAGYAACGRQVTANDADGKAFVGSSADPFERHGMQRVSGLHFVGNKEEQLAAARGENKFTYDWELPTHHQVQPSMIDAVIAGDRDYSAGNAFCWRATQQGFGHWQNIVINDLPLAKEDIAYLRWLRDEALKRQGNNSS